MKKVIAAIFIIGIGIGGYFLYQKNIMKINPTTNNFSEQGVKEIKKDMTEYDNKIEKVSNSGQNIESIKNTSNEESLKEIDKRLAENYVPVPPKEIPSGSFVETSGIRIISPKSGDQFEAGSKITLRYEILKPVQLGVIFLPGVTFEKGSLNIDKDTALGIHTETITLPNKIGKDILGISEMKNLGNNFNPEEDHESVNGTITLTSLKSAISRLDVGDYDLLDQVEYPERYRGFETGVMYLSQLKSSPESVYVRAVYSDGKKLYISPSDKELTAIIANPNLATINRSYNQALLVTGLKEETETAITVSYKGLTKTIRLINPKCDMTMPCY
jgi:hypothetical protein